MNLIELKHPLAQDLMAKLRNKTTNINEFRKACNILSTLVILKATENLPLKSKNITTPLESCKGYILNQQPVFIPILRAGLGMLNSALELFPNAKVGMIGLERNENTGLAREYYCKIPDLNDNDNIIILDPMLATGGSILATYNSVSSKKHSSVVIASIIASKEGVDYVTKNISAVKIITAAVDPRLDENKFIRPGLGDCGDRLFAT